MVNALIHLHERYDRAKYIVDSLHGSAGYLYACLQTVFLSCLLRSSLTSFFAIFVVCLSCQSTFALSDTPQTQQSREFDAQKGLLRIYRSNVLKLTYQQIVYPENAIENNHEDDVVLKIVLDREGNIENMGYQARARYNSLNRAARKAVLKAAPFPTAPSMLEGNTFELTIPVKFRLSN